MIFQKPIFIKISKKSQAPVTNEINLDTLFYSLASRVLGIIGQNLIKKEKLDSLEKCQTNRFYFYHFIKKTKFVTCITLRLSLIAVDEII